MQDFKLPDFESAQGKKIFSNLLIGSQYPCMLDPTKTKQSIIKKLKVGSPLAMVEIEWNGKPYIAAIDPNMGMDIGTLGPGVYDYIKGKFRPHTKFVGRVAEKLKMNGEKTWSVRVEYRMYW